MPWTFMSSHMPLDYFIIYIRVEEQIGAFPRMTSTCVLKAVSFYFDILSLNERREHSSIQTCSSSFIFLSLALSISPSFPRFALFVQACHWKCVNREPFSQTFLPSDQWGDSSAVLLLLLFSSCMSSLHFPQTEDTN